MLFNSRFLPAVLFWALCGLANAAHYSANLPGATTATLPSDGGAFADDFFFASVGPGVNVKFDVIFFDWKKLGHTGVPDFVLPSITATIGTVTQSFVFTGYSGGAQGTLNAALDFSGVGSGLQTLKIAGNDSFFLDSEYSITLAASRQVIPEPSTAAMLLMSLGLLGWAQNRRRAGSKA